MKALFKFFVFCCATLGVLLALGQTRQDSARRYVTIYEE